MWLSKYASNLERETTKKLFPQDKGCFGTSERFGQQYVQRAEHRQGHKKARGTTQSPSFMVQQTIRPPTWWTVINQCKKLCGATQLQKQGECRKRSHWNKCDIIEGLIRTLTKLSWFWVQFGCMLNSVRTLVRMVMKLARLTMQSTRLTMKVHNSSSDYDHEVNWPWPKFHSSMREAHWAGSQNRRSRLSRSVLARLMSEPPWLDLNR